MRGPAVGVFIGLSCLVGCNSPGGTAAGVAAGVTLVGGQSPTQTIEQVFYVGVFDPLEQLPPAVYRLRVRGQASALSSTRFASGWVPAAIVDGLGSRLEIDGQGTATVEGEKSAVTGIAGRGLMMFGPEGFRAAPRDHRLAIVMGSNPEEFFRAVSQALGTVTEVQQERLESTASQKILEELYRLLEEREALEDVERRLDANAKAVEEGS